MQGCDSLTKTFAKGSSAVRVPRVHPISDSSEGSCAVDPGFIRCEIVTRAGL
jgi:hypothetical protein